jgi:molybdate transport system substrate-binding protein
MDHLAERQLITDDTRIDLLGNALVLVAPADSTANVAIGPQFDLTGVLGSDGRLAMGEPNSVPAGKYAKAALVSLGAWTGIESRIVSADNVRAALNFVVRGEAPLGIVYRSDAVSEPGVRVLDTFGASTHAPIVYPVAVLREHEDADARAVLAVLRAPEATAIFKRFGFDAPPR